ncbi:MAG: hypothetical protein VB108_08400 [Anaerolineaceae bacterium]|nr:hypothetical protein [Anaerolineaceae bacterium]
MILITSIGLLLGGSLVVLVMNRFQKRISLAWLFSMAVSLIALALVYFLRLYLPSHFELIAWKPLSIYNNAPFLQISYQSWPYAVAMITLLAAVIITDPSRSQNMQSAVPWAGLLGLGGLHLAAITAGDPLSIIAAWTMIDIVEFAYLLRMQSFSGKNERLISALSLRWLSVLALQLATMAGWQIKPGFSLAEIPSGASLFFLLAAALRLGVLPIYVPYLTNERVPRGIAAISRLAPAFSALTLIAHLPGEFLTLSKWLINALHLFALLAALYASLFWLTRENLSQGRPYWIIALSAFVVQSALNGQPEAGQAWGLAMLLVGGELFLFDPPIRRINFLPLLALLGLVGLPYTPAGIGWQGLISPHFTWTGAIFILSHALLVAGYLRYTAAASSTITGLEKHVRFTFPFGLILILFSIAVLGIIGRPEALSMSPWLPPVISLGLVSFGAVVSFKIGFGRSLRAYTKKIPGYRFIPVIFSGVQSVFSLGWVYSLGIWLIKPLRSIGEFLSGVFESEGGTIWYLVFMVILLTLFMTRIKLP